MTDTEIAALVERLIRWTVEYERSPTGAKGDERNLAKDALLAAILALQQRVRELELDCDYMRGLLTGAKCPDCDGRGYMQIGMDELQCEWCFRQEAAIAEGGKP